jgi:hypothetical protein
VSDGSETPLTVLWMCARSRGARDTGRDPTFLVAISAHVWQATSQIESLGAVPRFSEEIEATRAYTRAGGEEPAP